MVGDAVAGDVVTGDEDCACGVDWASVSLCGKRVAKKRKAKLRRAARSARVRKLRLSGVAITLPPLKLFTSDSIVRQNWGSLWRCWGAVVS